MYIYIYCIYIYCVYIYIYCKYIYILYIYIYIVYIHINPCHTFPIHLVPGLRRLPRAQPAPRDRPHPALQRTCSACAGARSAQGEPRRVAALYSAAKGANGDPTLHAAPIGATINAASNGASHATAIAERLPRGRHWQLVARSRHSTSPGHGLLISPRGVGLARAAWGQKRWKCGAGVPPGKYQGCVG